jgi:transcription-repair coupling factor (superfamily II helicase)
VTQLKGEKPRFRLDVDLKLDFVATNEAEFVSSRNDGFPAVRLDVTTRKPSLLEKIQAFIPITYVSDPSLRIRAYRDVAEVTTREQLQRLGRTWRDRFGPFPAAVDNLFGLIEIKLAAAKSGINRVEVRERKLMLTRRGDFILVAGKFPRLVGAEIGQHLREILELIEKL